MEGSKLTKPVMLPSGRDMLATKSWPTGSTMFPKMIGMVLVCCFSICVVDELDEKITSGFRDDLFCQPLKRVHVGSAPAVVDAQVAALDPSELLQTIAEGRDPALGFDIILG